jgi:hypothetical protein
MEYGIDPSTSDESVLQALALDAKLKGQDNHSLTNPFSRFFMGQLGGSLSTLLGSGADVDGYMENGKFVPRTCFTKGTLVVKLKDSYKEKILTGKLEPNSLYEEKVAIETIKVGDYVLSWKESNDKREYRKVLNTFIRETNTIYRLTYEDETVLETTWNHPFYIQDKGFVEARYLKAGDLSVTSNGKTLKLASIQIEDRIETVYNFEVEDTHTYFVGEDEVLVHNENYAVALAKISHDSELYKISMENGVVLNESSITCVATKSCGEISLRVTNPDNSSQLANYSKAKDGTFINANDKNDKLVINKKGEYVRLYSDKEGNEFEANLGANINGENSLKINGSILKHGDMIVRSGEFGKMQIIEKKNIASYVKEKGITNAVTSTNGVLNTGSDAVGMLKAVTSITDNENAFHLYNDPNVFEGIDKDSKLGGLGNRDKPTVQDSLSEMIKAGAFSTGGSIICHSAGGNTCAKAILKTEIKIEADVYTFGGVHNTAGNKYTKTWTDVDNKGDLVSLNGGVDRGSLDRPGEDSTPPLFDEKKKNYLLFRNFNNGRDGVKVIGNNPNRTHINEWKTNELLKHNFQNSYLEGLKQLYKINRGGKK